MSKLRNKLSDLFARDKLVTDGGTLWKTAAGEWRKQRILKFASSGGFFLITLAVAIATIGLPFPGKVKADRPQATEIYAKDNQTLLYKLRGEKNRTSIDFPEMPKCIKDATVAVEDKDFYKHKGFDPRGFARAFYTDVASRSTVGGGGSTITQQLVKNVFLSPEQTITRKTKELVLSLEIEQMFAKDEILRIYLNEIPYGNSAYGIQAAAQTYFGKNAKELTLPECATLAAIPRAPTYYSPYNNTDPNRLKIRAKYVVDQMVGEKYVTEAEGGAAKAEIDKGLEYTAAKGEEIKAPHFVFFVREQLEQKFGAKRTQEGGYRVVTTLDPAKQDMAEDVIKTAARTKFAGYGATNAALTSIDHRNGDVVAMVGSADYFDVAREGNVNVATSERQPGSSIKPLFYLAAFQKGRADTGLALNPATLLWDVKTDFGGGYAPNNYDQKFRGPVSARDSLQQSLNVTSVKMLDLVGVPDAVRFANRMGITSLKPEKSGDYGLALVLGGGEVKLVDMATAYGVVANKGEKVPTRAILKIDDIKKKTIFKADDTPKKERVVSEALAYQLTNVLTDDAARAPQFGRNSALTLPGREAAAKTGTTDSYRDAWTMGYTPQLTTGVWLGNNDNSPMNQTGGSVGAAPIWQEYMRRALQDQKEEKFERPNGVKEEQVDRLTGLKPNGGPTKKEIFTTENAPTDKSPVAGDTCGKVDVKSGLKSERPSNPNWENPVQAFIRSRGITISGFNDTKSAECGPTVSIVSPGNGDKVSGTITIQARATSDRGIKNVSFTWDGQEIGSKDSPPFTVSYTIRDTSGTHTIAAKAVDQDGNEKTATITVTVGEDEDDKPASLELSCTGSRVCTASSDQDLTDVVLVNPDTGETIPMSGSGSGATATAPATWSSAFARGNDSKGNSVKSNTVKFSAGSNGNGNGVGGGVGGGNLPGAD